MTKERLIYVAIIVIMSLILWNSCQKETEIITPDSITVIEYRDKIIIDTVYSKPIIKTIYRNVPEYIYLRDTTIRHYTDSLVAKNFKVVIYDDIIGELTNRYFEYESKPPIVIEKEITKTIFKDKLIYQPIKGNFIGAKIGYNYKDTTATVGIQYVRYNNNRAFSLGYDFGGLASVGYMIRF